MNNEYIVKYITMKYGKQSETWERINADSFVIEYDTVIFKEGSSQISAFNNFISVEKRR